MKRRVWLFAWLLLVPGLSSADVPSEVRERFDQGNRLYAAEDFEGAEDAYRAILDSGYEAAAVYFNLGNASLKAGRLGEAVWAYRRASGLDPGDPDITANLAHARALTRDTIDRGTPSAFLRLASAVAARVPASRAWSLALGAFWVVGFAVAAGLVVPGTRRIARTVAWSAAFVVVFVGGYGLYRHAVVDSRDAAVVLPAEVDVRSAPDETGPSVFTVHAGTEVDVDREIGGWLEISLGPDLKGWIRAASLARI